VCMQCVYDYCICFQKNTDKHHPTHALNPGAGVHIVCVCMCSSACVCVCACVFVSVFVSVCMCVCSVCTMRLVH